MIRSSSITDVPRGPRGCMSHSESCPAVIEMQKELYNNYKCCKECGSDRLSVVRDTDDKVLVVCCLDCSCIYGFDDTTSADYVYDLYRKHQLCTLQLCCDNQDPDKFIIVDVNENGWQVRCQVCDKLSIIEGALTLELQADPSAYVEDKDDLSSNDNPAMIVDDEVFQTDDFSVTPEEDKIVKCSLHCDCGNCDENYFSMLSDCNEVKVAYCNKCGEPVNPEKQSTSDLTKNPGDYGAAGYLTSFVHSDKLPDDREHGSHILTLADQAVDDKSLAHFISCSCTYSARKVTCIQVENVEIIECMTCMKSLHIPKEEKKHLKKPNKRRKVQEDDSSTTSVSKTSSKAEDEMVKDISLLKRGTHVYWDRREGYFHHAIVEYVVEATDQLNVIHYNGPSPTGNSKIKGEIVAQTVAAFGSGTLYERKYDECDDPDTVISRAYSRLGEVKYSLLTNNCEHFCTWCKTGRAECSQVNKVIASVSQHVTRQGTYQLQQGINTVIKKAGKYIPKNLASESADDVVNAAVKGSKPVSKLGVGIGIAAAVGMEVNSCVKDFKSAVKQRNKGQINNKELAKILVRRSTKGIGSVVGSTGGAAIGQILVPVPIVGAFIGGTLGGVLGEGLGWVVGSATGEAISKHVKA